MRVTQTKCNCVLMSAAILAVLSGCASHQYLLKLSDGAQVIAVTKPKLQGNDYYFTDDSGQQDVVPKSRVVKVQAISLVKEEQPAPKPTTPKKLKHWYFLWLA
jgi:hypothetical protein